MRKARSETKANFLPLDIIKISDIPENKEITVAWEQLRCEFDYGRQHDWTAMVAAWKYPMINMGIEKMVGDYRPTSQSIEKYGAIVKTP